MISYLLFTTGLPSAGTTKTDQYCNADDESDNAVDGDLYGTCSKVKSAVDPWWSVKLDGKYSITQVVIQNRDDFGGKLHNFFLNAVSF